MPDSCPSETELLRLVEGCLAEPEQTLLLEHLDTCAVCQGHLDTVGGGGWSVADFRHEKRSPDSDALARVMGNLVSAGAAAAAQAAEPLLTASATPKRFGNYEVQSELGRGGMGVVYRAKQLTLNRTVALKLVLAGQLASSREVRRFHTEAEAAGRLDHPHIVPIYEVGEHDGRHFFTMRLVEGTSLAEHISYNRGREEAHSAKSEIKSEPPYVGCYPQKHAARLLATLARAVHYAHERGVLHRDLKPSNILLDSGGQPHLTDFGLAKLLESAGSSTLSAVAMGTPNYMAPEIADGRAREATTAADIYSLGAILFEVLAGRPPFLEETVAATLRQVTTVEAPPPSRFNPDVTRDLDTITVRCLDKDPARRYRTALEFAEDLERFIRHEPIAARPVTAVERVWRWVRRNPRMASLAATTVLVFLLGFAGVVWQWQRAERTAEREARERQRADTNALAEAQQRQRAEAEELSARRHLYSAHVNLARKAWEEGSARRAIDLLEAHQPKPGQEDLRGFEWFYLWDLCHRERRSWSLAGLNSWQPRLNWRIAFAPRAGLSAVILPSSQFGQTFLEAKPLRPAPKITHDYVLLVQNLTSGKTLGSARFSTQNAPDDGTPGLALGQLYFSPNGRHIALFCPSQTKSGSPWYVALWDVNAVIDASQKSVIPPSWAETFPSDLDPEIRRRLWLLGPGAAAIEPSWLAASEGRRFSSVMFAGDGQWVAGVEETMPAIDAHGTLRIWNVATRSMITNFGPLIGFGWKLILSADERILSATTRTGLSTNKPSKPLPGRPFITATNSWEPGSWRPLTNHVTSFDPSAPGFFSATNAVARVIAARNSGSSLDQMREQGRAALSPDGNTLALANETAVEWWDVRTGRLLRTFAAHTEEVRRVDFLSDGRTIVSVGDDGYVRFWDLTTLDEAALLYSRLRERPEFPGRPPCFSRDGSMVIVDYYPVRITNWVVLTNLLTGAEHIIRSTNDPPGRVSVLAFSLDGTRVAGVEAEPLGRTLRRQIKVWDMASGNELASFGSSEVNVVFYNSMLVFSPDGKRLAMAASNHTAIVWDLERRVELGQFRNAIRKPPGPVFGGGFPGLVFAPDGRSLVGASYHTVNLWELETGKSRDLSFLEHSIFAFSPDWKTVATAPSAGARAGPVVLWNWPTKEQRLVLGHYTLAALAFSSDGKTLAAATRDGVIRLWQVATGDELFSLPAPIGRVPQVTFTPDGRTLLAAVDDALYAWHGTKP